MRHSLGDLKNLQGLQQSLVPKGSLLGECDLRMREIAHNTTINRTMYVYLPKERPNFSPNLSKSSVLKTSSFSMAAIYLNKMHISLQWLLVPATLMQVGRCRSILVAMNL
ncbi:hypothetical protein E2P81_ATG03277 [Venturia nashicola]|uniref:Uncharacterized protein n=1 Tax=Venturia nashicola TaxID=86259 RepID=A0A4Z1P4I0_9PEZI|nr:hypothetical protein E6O75_ATG03343 [Venturia nashicola]TLD36388.1 hypothetical protein E2P81_ATG03277 [Venturia nashicola]